MKRLCCGSGTKPTESHSAHLQQEGERLSLVGSVVMFGRERGMWGKRSAAPEESRNGHELRLAELEQSASSAQKGISGGG